MGKKVGIDSIAYYVPGIYLDIETLALKRDIVPAKLQKGLGLTAMLSIPTFFPCFIYKYFSCRSVLYLLL